MVMAYDPAAFEKLGAFFLGRPEGSPDEPLLYDSRDLVTHAVCVGMTGSGKTGLCVGLIEEAAIDGVPAIIIDPKGDLANLALSFPELRPEDFRPWIDEAEAARKGMSADEFARSRAELWQNGLAQWGQGPDRIRRYRGSAEVRIHTPGSLSGIPVNILASFAAPPQADEEILAERAQSTAASLLGMINAGGDPLQSREGIFLATILSDAWRAGRSHDLESLIAAIQHPPFDKLGVLDLETFYPVKDRFALVLALNNLLAAPGFAAWRAGSPMNIDRFLWSPEGKPRISVFSIAHLDDRERMFFVSLLLNEVLAWTRRQTGTSSLRAILYMDEIFGFLPPTANPPSKRPMLTMLKQARAFGVGVVLATQNPVDLDYKALSNAGTWFIGRLQTERDVARVLDGLQGVDAGGFDRQTLSAQLANLRSRVFLLRNVHDPQTVLFETRWTLNYLCGPLARDQIKALTPQAALTEPAEPAAPEVNPAQAGPQVPNPAPTPQASAHTRTSTRPPVAPGIQEIFLPGDSGPYRPVLLGMADIAYRNARLDFDAQESVALIAQIPAGLARPDWSTAAPLQFQPENASPKPAPGFAFDSLPAAASQTKNFSAWEKAFVAWLRGDRTRDVPYCKKPKLVSRPDEEPGSFRARVALAAREIRDEEIAALRERFAKKRATLEQRLARAEATVRQHQERAAQTRIQSAISVGSSLLGAFLGRNKLSTANIGRAATAARGIGRTLKGSASLEAAQASAQTAHVALEALENELLAALSEVATAEPDIETRTLKPARGGVTGVRLFLAWCPSRQPGA
jgi:hypothetical protein